MTRDARLSALHRGGFGLSGSRASLSASPAFAEASADPVQSQRAICSQCRFAHAGYSVLAGMSGGEVGAIPRAASREIIRVSDYFFVRATARTSVALMRVCQPGPVERK
jgi:hypothetical protein